MAEPEPDPPLTYDQSNSSILPQRSTRHDKMDEPEPDPPLNYDQSLAVCQSASIEQLAAYYKFRVHISKEAIVAVAKQRFRTFKLGETPIIDINIGAVCQLLATCVRHLTIEWEDASREFQRHAVELVSNTLKIAKLCFRGMPTLAAYGPHFLQHVCSFNLRPAYDSDYGALAKMLATLSPKRLANVVIELFTGSGEFLAALPTNSLRSVCLISVHGLDMGNVHRLCSRSPQLVDLMVYMLERRPTDMAPLVASCAGGSLQSLYLSVGPLLNLAELARLRQLTELQLADVGQHFPEEFERFAEAIEAGHPLCQLNMECERFTERMALGLLRFRQLRQLQLESWQPCSGLRLVFDSVAGHPSVRELLVTGVQEQHECPSAVAQMQQLQVLQYTAEISGQLMHLAAMPGLRTLCLTLRMWKSDRFDRLSVLAEAKDAASKALAIRWINEFLRQLAAANRVQRLWLQVPLLDFRMELEPLTLRALAEFSSLRDLQIQGFLRCPQIVDVLQVTKGLERFANSGCTEEAQSIQLAGLFQPVRPSVTLDFRLMLEDFRLR